MLSKKPRFLAGFFIICDTLNFVDLYFLSFTIIHSRMVVK